MYLPTIELKNELSAWRINCDTTLGELMTILSTTKGAHLQVSKDAIRLEQLDGRWSMWMSIYETPHSAKAVYMLTDQYGECNIYTQDRFYRIYQLPDNVDEL